MNPTLPAMPREQILEQLERLLTSKHFCQTRSLGKFLQYAVLKTLTGEETDLKESLLGREVFDRGVEFDPAKDSVVRVQAIALRKKLTTYYLEEGLGDEILISLPKGHYVPEFSYRAPDENLPSTHLTLSEAVHEPFAPLQSSIAPLRNQPRWKTIGTVTLCFVLGLATAIVLQNWQRFSSFKIWGAGNPSANLSPDPAAMVLWEKFMQPGAENILAYGTPQFFVANGIFLRDVQVNSPEEFATGTRLKAIQSTLQNTAQTDLKPTEIYTGVGEAHGVFLLSKFLLKTAIDLKVTSSRMIRWNELKNSNLIFLSSMRFHTLAKDLPFPNDFVIKAGQTGKIINLHPLEGEQTIYGRTAEDPVNDYAVITLWPGKSSQQRVLVLSGNTTFGTMAAAEYATEPEYLRQLYGQLEQCRIKRNSERHTPFFQVLVRAEVKENQPYKISYVTHHDLDIPEQSIEGNRTAAVR